MRISRKKNHHHHYIYKTKSSGHILKKKKSKNNSELSLGLLSCRELCKMNDHERDYRHEWMDCGYYMKLRSAARISLLME